MRILQVLFLTIGLAVFANGQRAILSGVVYDAVGAVIVKAKITAVNEKGEIFETVTNDNGIYSLNLPYNNYDPKTSSANLKISKYEIIVDLENRGFERRVIKDFKFIPAYVGKMYFDIALDSINPEPCGYAGADCLQKTDKLQKPLEKLPKAKNYKEEKLINNEQFNIWNYQARRCSERARGKNY